MSLFELLRERVSINILNRIYHWNESKTNRIERAESIRTIEETNNYIFKSLDSFILLYSSKLINIKGRSREYSKEEILSILRINYNGLHPKEIEKIKELLSVEITSKGKEFIHLFDQLIYCFTNQEYNKKTTEEIPEITLPKKKKSSINPEIIDRLKSQLHQAEELKVIPPEEKAKKKLLEPSQIIIEYVLTNLEQKILLEIFNYDQNNNEQITPKKITQSLYPYEPYKKKSSIISHYLKKLEELHLIKRYKIQNKTKIEITASGKRTVVDQDLESTVL